MSTPPSSILIYGICETPSILWNAYSLNPRRNNINRQYICLDDESLTLRIGSKGWLEVKPEQLLKFQSNNEINAYTKEVLLSKVNAFSRPIKNALVSYFNWVDNECLKFGKDKLLPKADRLFAKAEQLFYNAFLPLPHPKIVMSDEDGVFQGVANFDLGFCIKGRIYLFTLSHGKFVRKTEREFRKKLFKNKNKFIYKDLPKPIQSNKFDIEFINKLVNTVPNLNQFIQSEELPHGIYYPNNLNFEK